jgi:hypothetical protein
MLQVFKSHFSFVTKIFGKMFFVLFKYYCKAFVCILIYLYRIYNKPILTLMSFDFIYVDF